MSTPKIIKNANFTSGRNCGKRTEAIKYIVIHYTGSEGTAADNIKYFNDGNRGASAHYFVGRDGEIREYCDPDKWYAWQCGGSIESAHHPLRGICTNRNSIGIEICTHYTGGQWTFTDKAVNAATELTRYFMDKYDIPIDRVCRHYDVTGKSCPRVPGWGAVGGSAKWEAFLKAVQNLNAKTTEAKTETKTETKTEEKTVAETKTEAKARGITFYYPGFTRKGSPYDYQGGGCLWHDQNGHTLVYDCYMKNSAAANKMISYLKKNKLTIIDYAIVSHAHPDHGGGIIQMIEYSGLKIVNLLCYNPESLKLAGDGSANARAAKSDKAYLNGIISKAKAKGIKVTYLKTGDVITCGEMHFTVFRQQPTAWSEYDQGHAYAYLNDGSINLYEKNTCVHLCGDGGGEAASKYYNKTQVVCEAEHHGNGGGRAAATEYVKKGCKLGVECNNEKSGPGSCEFTRYGAGRMKEAGIDVWMEDADILGVAKAGKLTVTQGSKKKEFSVPFCSVLYRVRKTWADSKSQLGAYSVLANAKAKADEAGSAYGVFDENGKEVYRPASKTTETKTETTAKTDNEKFMEEIGALAKADMEKTGICAALTVAQAILESGWGKSELAVNAKNLFGMKCSLSGNTWSGSTWDGKSAYNKSTKEVYSGKSVTVTADFRAYKSWAESVADHSAYLAGAMNGSKKRYDGLVGCADYKKAAEIVKAGGYATAMDYVSKLCKLVEQYGLTKYNTTYTTPKTEAIKLPYLVKVKKAVKIYKAAAGIYSGKNCPVGIYTIVQEKDGYGKLKSGAGWIKFDGNILKV